MTVDVEHGLPSAKTFRTLWSNVSWGTPIQKNAQHALDNSLCGVIATLNGETIGMRIGPGMHAALSALAKADNAA